MDTTDPLIRFDSEGRCNHCLEVDEYLKKWNPDGDPEQLKALVARIRRDGRGQDYDVAVGLSGGVDSSYLAFLAKQLGLRALIIHVDTGWNSELAVKNIENIVNHLGFDLHTLVVNWAEMQDVQYAFFKSGVPNQDIPQDHAITAGFFLSAAQYKIRWAFSGSNLACESILPKSWGYDAMDLRHLEAIHRRFGKRPIVNFPRLSYWQRDFKYNLFHNLKMSTPLNLIPYRLDTAIKTLERELGWRYYGGKHFESRLTKFFQGWYLPVKWGYDKRMAHLSSLVVSGQLSREEALSQLRNGSLPTSELVTEKDFMARKLGLNQAEFEEILQVPNCPHDVYPRTSNLQRNALKGYRTLMRLLLPWR
jgi:N-acetyl sugar amidotransferase